MKSATKWALIVFVVALAAGCATQSPATTESNDSQQAPQESASTTMPLGAGDMFGMNMFHYDQLQTADVRD